LVWQEAWKRWRGLGRGATYTIVRGKISNPESYHPFLVAAVEAEENLRAACKGEFAKPDWIVTCLVGIDRRPIDGDAFRAAEIIFPERSASIGTFGEQIYVSALRVRRVTMVTPVEREIPVWMDLERPWIVKIPRLVEAARKGTLPLGTPAVPQELIKGNFVGRGAMAACLRWFCLVTDTPLDKSNKAPSAMEKAFRDYRRSPKWNEGGC